MMFEKSVEVIYLTIIGIKNLLTIPHNANKSVLKTQKRIFFCFLAVSDNWLDKIF